MYYESKQYNTEYTHKNCCDSISLITLFIIRSRLNVAQIFPKFKLKNIKLS